MGTKSHNQLYLAPNEDNKYEYEIGGSGGGGGGGGGGVGLQGVASDDTPTMTSKQMADAPPTLLGGSSRKGLFLRQSRGPGEGR